MVWSLGGNLSCKQVVNDNTLFLLQLINFINMKRYLLSFIFFSISIFTFAASKTNAENIDNINVSNSGNSFNKEYKIECNAGSVISISWQTYCRFRSGFSPYGEIYIDDKLKANISCNFAELIKDSVNIKIQESGIHTLTINMLTSNDINPSRFDLNFNACIIKSLEDDNGYYYHMLSDNSLKIVSPINLQSNTLVLPEEVSIPFKGFYKLSEIEGAFLKDNKNIFSLSIPSTIVEIGDSAFYRCNNLNEVLCYAKTAPLIHKYTFNPGTKIHVYKDSYWYDSKEYANLVIIKDLDEISGIRAVIEKNDKQYYSITGNRIKDINQVNGQVLISNKKKFINK